MRKQVSGSAPSCNTGARKMWGRLRCRFGKHRLVIPNGKLFNGRLAFVCTRCERMWDGVGADDKPVNELISPVVTFVPADSTSTADSVTSGADGVA